MFLLFGVTHCFNSSDGPASGAAAGGSSLGAAGSSASAGAPPQTGLGGGGSAGVSSGGAASAASSAGAAGNPDPLGPTKSTATAKFPFPQNRFSSNCRYPAFHNNDVRAAYQWWKTDMVTADGAGGHLRVKRTPTDTGLDMGSTVSEGIGYGMLIAVYMDDQPLFDELWKYEQQWLSKFGLMDWYIDAAGSKRLGEGAASDADEDMAFALLMADRQWGGQGSLDKSYLDVAKDQIQKMWDHEVHESKLLKPGDSWDLPDPWKLVNVSYFAPSYYRAFAAASGNAGWNDVVSTAYDTLENSLNDQNGNKNNGLVPAWSTSDGAPTNAAFANAPTNYQYDSCRTPFRVGIDYCINGEARAKAYVAKTSQFFAGIGAAQIVDGYGLDGSPQASHTPGQSAAFVGPVTVGAMSDPTFSTLLEQGYAAVATRSLLVGGEYYDGSWTMISLLMLSGNFLDYTKEQPLSP
ncbi:MAG: glycosyl hydrolase family 8 [Polyangiaceae bacterium]